MKRQGTAAGRAWVAVWGLAALCAMLGSCDGSGAGADAAAGEPDAVGFDIAFDLATPGPPDVSAKDTEPTADAEPAGPTSRAIPPPTFINSAGHVVAIGDVHGDIDRAFAALQLVGVVGADGHWSGGDIVCVQVGDQLDRGDDERAILHWFEQLSDEAHAAGGAFLPLVGNHEQMNVQEDFRYVTDGGWSDFADVAPTPGTTLPGGYESWQLGRVAAFVPGGTYARLIGEHNVIQVVDDTLFVHGGVLPQHLPYGLGAINAEHRAWARGEGQLSALWLEDSPVWDRHYSDTTGAFECALLEEVLSELGLERMVVAHTVQVEGVNAACGGRVWRVDVGLATYYGGAAQGLRILAGEVSVLR